MKRLLILQIIAASIMFSCRSSDETTTNANIVTPENNSPILGKWKLTKRLVDGAEDPIPECQLNSTEEFFKDGKYIATSYSPFLDCKENISYNTYKYDATAKKLTIGNIERKEIVTIEGNELKYIDEKNQVTYIFTKQ